MQALALAHVHLFTATPPRISAGSTVYCQHLIMRIQVITVQSSSLILYAWDSSPHLYLLITPARRVRSGIAWSKHVLCTVGDFCVLSWCWSRTIFVTYISRKCTVSKKKKKKGTWTWSFCGFFPTWVGSYKMSFKIHAPAFMFQVGYPNFCCFLSGRHDSSLHPRAFWLTEESAWSPKCMYNYRNMSMINIDLHAQPYIHTCLCTIIIQGCGTELHVNYMDDWFCINCGDKNESADDKIFSLPWYEQLWTEK